MLPSFPSVAGAENPGNPILKDPKALRAALAAPFDPRHVEWRVGPVSNDKAQALCYIDARAVRRRLNDVCGIGGWQGIAYQIAENQVGFAIAIWINGQWVVKADGAFAGILSPRESNGKVDKKEEQRLDKDAKSAVSGSLKRAGAAWGIGEYFYDLDSPWVAVKKNKSGFVDGFTEESEKRLFEIAAKPWRAYQDAEATKHEKLAHDALDKGDLTTANNSARAACRIRDAVFGQNHETTRRAIALLAEVKKRMAPPVAPAQEPAPAVEQKPAEEPQDKPAPITATASLLDTVISALASATTVDAVKAEGHKAWETWPAESPEGIAFRSALERNMQRFDPKWTLASAAAAKKTTKKAKTAA